MRKARGSSREPFKRSMVVFYAFSPILARAKEEEKKHSSTIAKHSGALNDAILVVFNHYFGFEHL